jgi:hypothetical protein
MRRGFLQLAAHRSVVLHSTNLELPYQTRQQLGLLRERMAVDSSIIPAFCCVA